jgi:hypothetical protein
LKNIGEKCIIHTEASTKEKKEGVCNRTSVQTIIMEGNVVTQSTELQKIIQKLEKLEKLINPNSKKSLILWEEDNSFKMLISDLKNYALTCSTDEFPIELLDRLSALQTNTITQIVEGANKITVLKEQAKKNLDLSESLSSMYIAAMARDSLDEFEDILNSEELSNMKDQLQVVKDALPDSEEYIKAEKAVKSKISNLENSVHITIDLERTISKGGALEYIKKEIEPAIIRLQTAYDDKYAVKEEDNVITALAIRRTFTEKLYDALIRPFTKLFKRKAKN